MLAAILREVRGIRLFGHACSIFGCVSRSIGKLENLDPSWRTVTTNMEGGLMIGCSKGEKVEEEKCDLAISPHFPIFRGSTTSYNGICDHR